MSNLKTALAQLDAEIETIRSPQEGSVAWFRLRALSTAASMLRAADVRSFEDPQTFETYRRKCRNLFVNEIGAED